MRGYSVGTWEEHTRPINVLDVKRHSEKVREALQNNLADMVSDSQIELSDGQKTVRVPLNEYNEYRIRYADGPDAEHAFGHREGGEGAAGDGATKDKDDVSKQGGNEEGRDIEETSVTLDEVKDIIFSDLVLPDFDPTRKAPGSQGQSQAGDLRRVGRQSQWAKKPTLLANLHRNARHRQPQYSSILPEDLRFRVYDQPDQEEGGCVVLAMMDTSGSMGQFEKYLAKSFFFWTVEFLRTAYPYVDIVFLAHDVRAREVDEDAFFHRGASGGTVSSSVYRLATEILEKRYPADRFNAYGFHFTDGGNLTSDNPLAVERAAQLSARMNLFGYGEIHDTERNPSPLYQALREQEQMNVVVLRKKSDIFGALKVFFSRGRIDNHAVSG